MLGFPGFPCANSIQQNLLREKPGSNFDRYDVNRTLLDRGSCPRKDVKTKENHEAKLMSTHSFVSFNKHNKLYHSVTDSMKRPGEKSRGRRNVRKRNKRQSSFL